MAAMLEKNRDNLAAALPRLGQFVTTLGETVSNGPYYTAFVPNLLPAQIGHSTISRLRFRISPRRRRRPAARQRRTARRIPLSLQRHPGATPMTSRGLFTRLLAASFTVALVGAAYIIVQGSFLRPTTITAIFTTATAIYPGDEVRVSGVKVGTVESIDPRGADTELVLKVDHGVSIPLDASAVIVAQNLVSARYVQLTPVISQRGTDLARRSHDTPRSHRRPRRVGRGQGSADPTGHRTGTDGRYILHIDGAIHRKCRRRAW